MKFLIWLERRDFEIVKNVVLSSLFPDLGNKEAEDNVNMKITDLDNSLIDDMLKRGEIEERLEGRDVDQFLSNKNVTIANFIDWITQNPAALALK